MRFNLDRIFVADRGLIIIGAIIVFYSILCLIGVLINSFLILLIVYYNSMLTIIFLSIFSMGALAMNDNLLDWIDNHWDILRSSVFSYDMNKFKDHVTTEINSLGIFSLTINSTLLISMACITNLLSLKNIIIAISPLINIIFSVLSTGLVVIGMYSYFHSDYTTMPIWSSIVFILFGILLFAIGILGYLGIKKMNRKYLLYHIIILSICLILLSITCFSFFIFAGRVSDVVNTNWNEIQKNLLKSGLQIRKSFFSNQIQVNLKFAGFYSSCFLIFSFLSFGSSLYQHYSM